MLKTCIYFVIVNHMYNIMYRNIFPVICTYANTAWISNFNTAFTIQRRKLNNKRQLPLRSQVGTSHSLLIYGRGRGGVKHYSVFIECSTFALQTFFYSVFWSIWLIIQQSNNCRHCSKNSLFQWWSQVIFQLLGCSFQPLCQRGTNEMGCSCKSDLWNDPKYPCKALLFLIFNLRSFKRLNLQHRGQWPSMELYRRMNHQLD